jgi:hypothetical protein
MPADDLSPEASKLLAARKAAAEELQGIDGVERAITDHSVLRLANARLYEAAITMRVVTGEIITAAEFKAASDMVEQARAAAKAAPSIKLTIVSGVTGIFTCKHCGKRNEIPDYEAPPKPSAPPPTIDLKAEPKGKAEATPEAAVLPPPERKHPGSIHDQPGVPLKRYDEPWRAYGRTL